MKCNYDHQINQLPTKTLINPKNLCSINSSMPLLENDHDERVGETPPTVDECRGIEDMNIVSKLRNEKNLRDPYESSVKNNPKKGEEEDL